MARFGPGGTIYEAMKLARKGQSVLLAQRSQPSVIDVEGLPWPLSVPWVGSFLTSSNPSRDLLRHGIFAEMEVELVAKYRELLIGDHEAIGNLRSEISLILEGYLGNDIEFQFPDGIEIPSYGNKTQEKLASILLSERLSTSHERYNNQVEDIIKFCARQPVMLAHPHGDEDSIVVREAFVDFINVSGSACLSCGMANIYYRPSQITSPGLLRWRDEGLIKTLILMMLSTMAIRKFGILTHPSISCEMFGRPMDMR